MIRTKTDALREISKQLVCYCHETKRCQIRKCQENPTYENVLDCLTDVVHDAGQAYPKKDWLNWRLSMKMICDECDDPSDVLVVFGNVAGRTAWVCHNCLCLAIREMEGQ